jgi:hypothetical protein
VASSVSTGWGIRSGGVYERIEYAGFEIKEDPNRNDEAEIAQSKIHQSGADEGAEPTGLYRCHFIDAAALHGKPAAADSASVVGAGASRGAPLGSGRMRVEERDVIGNRLLGARRIDRIWCGCGRLRGRPNFKPAHAPCSIVDRGCEGAKVVRRSVLQFFSSQSACSCVQPVKATSPASVVGHVLITARLASPRRSPSSSGMSTPHGTASQAASTWRYS